MTVLNIRKVDKKGPDFYPTPSWATRALLDYENFDGDIWEPCCGNGAISKILEEKGYTVTSSDLNDFGYGKIGIDFLQTNNKVNNIITNPPYNIAGDILEKALYSSTKKVCLLVRTSFLESVKRYNKFYSQPGGIPSTVYMFSQRLSLYPEGHKVNGGGMTSYSWIVWDKSNTTCQTILKWIEPGYKE